MKYVAGFMFSRDLASVALIRKAEPEWQRGKLNGVGGKIEEGESSVAAMQREFAEETGWCTSSHIWRHFAALSGPDWSLDFYFSKGDLALVDSREEEKIEIIAVDSIAQRSDVIENLPWLVGLALDALHDGRPVFATISYP